MLDDLSAALLARSLVAVLGVDFFALSQQKRSTPTKLVNHSVAYNIRAIQALQQRSGIWKLIFAYSSEDDLHVYDRLCNFSLQFVGTVSVATHSLEGAREMIQAADLVYAPRFCELHEIRPTLQPPSSVNAVLGIIDYFSVVPVPFSAESYYQALKTYDPATNRVTAQG